MQTNYAQFSEDGKEVTIHLGEEKLGPFTSKYTALKKLISLSEETKISIDDINRMGEEIIEAKNLIDDDSPVEISITSLIFGLEALMEILFDTSDEEDNDRHDAKKGSAKKEIPKEAYFKMCTADTCRLSRRLPHGKIFFSTGYSTAPIVSAEHGMQYLTLAQGEHIKTQKEFEQVQKQIEAAFADVKEETEA